MASAFPWVVAYGIEPARSFRVGLETLPHKVGPSEDVRDLSGGDCVPNLIDCVMCVGV